MLIKPIKGIVICDKCQAEYEFSCTKRIPILDGNNTTVLYDGETGEILRNTVQHVDEVKGRQDINCEETHEVRDLASGNQLMGFSSTTVCPKCQAKGRAFVWVADECRLIP